MENFSINIHPTFDQLLGRNDKENLLKQKATCLWLTGLSGPGKTTIAKGLEKKLHNEGYMTQLLDGDNVRTGLCNNLSFSIKDRQENIRRIAELNKLFLEAGVITISCFVSPTIEIREMAKGIIGSDFQEVFINTPLEVCESRDVKGLYAKARKGEIKNFTGIDSPFEAPLNPNIELKTENQSIESSVEDLYSQIIETIKYS